MVLSKITNKLSYNETKEIDIEDKGLEMSIYEYDYNDKKLEIILGKQRSEYVEKHNIIYMSVYLIKNDKISEKIGIFEIEANELLNSLDEDEDVILENGNILFFEKALQDEPEREEMNKDKVDQEEVEQDEQINVEKDKNELLLFDKVLEKESKNDNDDIIDNYVESRNNTWIEKMMKNNNYSIEEVPPDGDCFFSSIVKSYDGTGKHINVEMLRNMVSKAANEEIYNQYYSIYNAIKDETQKYDIMMNEKRKTNKILKQRYDDNMNRTESQDILTQAQEIQNKYNDDKNSKTSTMELYEEFRFMEGIDSLEKFKEVLKTKNYWADTWAINVIEKNLNIKTVILSEESFNQGDNNNVLLCGQMNEDTTVNRPEYYILLSYLVNHYNLITYKNKSLLTFEELPYGIVKEIMDKCLEKNAGPYYEIENFKKLKKDIDVVDIDDDDDDDVVCNKKTIFMIHSRSNGKPRPGKGVGEKILENDIFNYHLLHSDKNNKDWRRKLDDKWNSEFVLEGKKWYSVTHYVYGNRYKKGFPDFYDLFSLDSDSAISKDVELATHAIGKSGKYKDKVLRNEGIKEDVDYDDRQSREKALMSKFSQNQILRKILENTNDACIQQYNKGSPSVNDNLMMKVRNSITLDSKSE
jgi:hypothetical protein